MQQALPISMQRRDSRNVSGHSQNNEASSSDHSPSLAKQILVEVLLTAVSAALSFLVVHALSRNGIGFNTDRSKNPKRSASEAQRRLKHQTTESFDAYEDIIAGDMVFPDEIEVKFDDIGGHERDKMEIFDLIALPLKHPDVFERLGKSELLSPPRGILLYGPPGTGKTMMAKAIAKESGAAFINLKMSTTMNLYFGESQKLVRATFSLAKKLSPCIIFIDEIDSFLHERRTDDNSAIGNMKAEFMALWDGVESDTDEGTKRKFGIVIVGATNRPWDVDPAILRRMPRTFEIGLPDAPEREKVLRLVLRNERLDPTLQMNLSKLAQACEGYSGSDLKEMCRAAAAIPYREFASNFRERQERSCSGQSEERDENQVRPLTMNDFLVARNNVKKSGETANAYHAKTEEEKHNSTDQHFDGIPQHPKAAFLAGMQFAFSSMAGAPTNMSFPVPQAFRSEETESNAARAESHYSLD